MENQTPGNSPKSRFRWGRFFLLIVVICLSMAIGYIGGNLLRAKLIKKLDELDEKQKDKATEVEDIAHEEVEDDDDDENEEIRAMGQFMKPSIIVPKVVEKLKDAEEVVEAKVKKLLTDGKKKKKAAATVK